MSKPPSGNTNERDPIAGSANGSPADLSRGSRSAWAMVLVILIAVSMLWIMRADHHLWPPDEGRYGAASLNMLQGGGWLMPELNGEPHLTKPPLLYWAQAWSLRILGYHELALRGPSLLASSLLTVILLAAGWRIGGPLVGVIAVGLLSLMPIHVGMSWLAITDPLLSLFWFSALTCGYFRIEQGKTIWIVLMWVAVAMGLLVKGPVILTPVGVLLLWLLISRRRREAWRLGIPIGLPASLLPLAIWAALVIRTHPEALDIWLHETVARSVGNGDHREPWWYYGPLFLVGVFPATAMIALPGWNLSFKEMWRRFRDGEPACLWVLAVLAPLVMFTLIAGKLPTYLLPLAAPMALLMAMTLRRWITGEADHPPAGTRPPETVAALTICATALTLAAVGAVIIFLPPSEVLMISPLLLLPPVCAWMWFIWKRKPDLRGRAILLVWAVGIICWCCGLRFEQRFFQPHSARTMLDRLPTLTGVTRSRPAMYGFHDPTVAFYARREVPILGWHDLQKPLDNRDGALILLADGNDWRVFADRYPDRAAMFIQLGDWSRWPDDNTLILQAPREGNGP